MKISFVPRLVIRSFSLLSSGNVITHPDGAIKLKMTSSQCLMSLATGYFSANERSLKTEKEPAIWPKKKTTGRTLQSTNSRGYGCVEQLVLPWQCDDNNSWNLKGVRVSVRNMAAFGGKHHRLQWGSDSREKGFFFLLLNNGKLDEGCSASYSVKSWLDNLFFYLSHLFLSNTVGMHPIMLQLTKLRMHTTDILTSALIAHSMYGCLSYLLVMSESCDCMYLHRCLKVQ